VPEIVIKIGSISKFSKKYGQSRVRLLFPSWDLSEYSDIYNALTNSRQKL
jgi:hypothetical protein